MDQTPQMSSRIAAEPNDARKRNAAIFVVVVAVWLLIDVVTKSLCNSHEVGEVIYRLWPDVLHIQLVHNYGAAWGLFSGATLALCIVSIAICLLLLLYLFKLEPGSSVPSVFGLALVFAGGVGNTIDRLHYGYVIDFIDPAFIDFPVFNVADIGVTCGFAIFFVSLLLEMGKSKHNAA